MVGANNMRYVLECLKAEDVVGVCPDCETQVFWQEISEMRNQSTLKEAGWGSLKFNCDSCHINLFAQVVSKPFKSLVITKGV